METMTIIRNHDIIHGRSGKSDGDRRLCPRSLIVPLLGIGILAVTGLFMLDTPMITVVGMIPLLLSIALMYGWRISTFRYIGWQMGLTAISVAFTAFVFFSTFTNVTLDGFAESALKMTDGTRAVATLIIGGYLPAAVNAAVYGAVSRSWKKTAVLVLSDPSFVDAVLITLGLITGFGVA